MARFFIVRPIFAWVVSLAILLAGLLALRALPVEQYPEVAPPSLTINVVYPGAGAETLEQNVTQVIEQQLNGVDGFLYMSSTSTSAAPGWASVAAPRATTRSSKSINRDRAPARTSTASTSTTSPARTGAENCTSE